jgi:hypothetical protein
MFTWKRVYDYADGVVRPNSSPTKPSKNHSEDQSMPSARLSFVLTLVLALVTSAFGATEKVLYSFTGGDDGDESYAGSVFDNAGNLYGTGHSGDHGAGVVFEVVR